VSRTKYAALFSVYGTTIGIGDGSTTFNVPTVADHLVQI
jgi:microcystin-dependent protein